MNNLSLFYENQIIYTEPSVAGRVWGLRDLIYWQGLMMDTDDGGGYTVNMPWQKPLWGDIYQPKGSVGWVESVPLHTHYAGKCGL